MGNMVLVGAQWGDEGKGKIIDYLTTQADWIVRYQGGNNAGHTVEFGNEKFILHLVPSGILHPGKTCVIGNGLVVDPVALVKELDGLRQRGIQPESRFWISDRAHTVFAHHRALDSQREKSADATHKIGTTQRGIGPAYTSKAARTGLRMGDLIEPDFPARLRQALDEVNAQLSIPEQPAPLDVEPLIAEAVEAVRRLRPHITDTIPLMHAALRKGASFLFEGAQGTLLDMDFGTYPYVTSSNATAGGACTGTGVPPKYIQRVIGVIKAYTTRVGEGPFPTELLDETGARLRKIGNEFGATTGRPRRCGWFDAVVARYAVLVNGIDSWAVTKLDVLDEMETIRVCTAYECDGERMEHFPAQIRRLERCRPVYEEHPGWLTSTKDVTNFEELPPRAQAYLRRIEEITGVPVGILSVGPHRERTLRLRPL